MTKNERKSNKSRAMKAYWERKKQAENQQNQQNPEIREGTLTLNDYIRAKRIIQIFEQKIKP